MKERNINTVWSLAMLVIGICTIMLGITGMTDSVYKDVLLRVIGVTDLLAVPVLTYTTVLKIKNR